MRAYEFEAEITQNRTSVGNIAKLSCNLLLETQYILLDNYLIIVLLVFYGRIVVIPSLGHYNNTIKL